jgi:hypothetical protein
VGCREFVLEGFDLNNNATEAYTGTKNEIRQETTRADRLKTLNFFFFSQVKPKPIDILRPPMKAIYSAL